MHFLSYALFFFCTLPFAPKTTQMLFLSKHVLCRQPAPLCWPSRCCARGVLTAYLAHGAHLLIKQIMLVRARCVLFQKMKVWISSKLFFDPSPLKFGSKNRYQSPETVPRMFLEAIASLEVTFSLTQSVRYIFSNATPYLPLQSNVTPYHPLQSNATTYHPLQSNATPYHPLQSNATPYHPLQSNATPYNLMPPHTIPYNSMPPHTILTIQYHHIPHHMTFMYHIYYRLYFNIP